MKDDMMKILLENPEFCKQMIDEMASKLKPVLAALGNQGLNILEDAVNCERFYEIVARDKHNAYDAYREVGFTSDQAMALILSESKQLKDSLNHLSGSVKASA